MKFTTLAPLLGTATTALAALPAVPVPRAANNGTAASLDTLAKENGKLYFGTCSDQDLIANNQHAETLKGSFGAVTHEYSLKWNFVQGTRGTFDFSIADSLANFAESNGQSIRGHTLLWHRELPGWVDAISDPEELTQVIKDHVSKVVGHYKGKVRAWDVVNEIFADDGSLRDSVFSRVLGEDFVKVAYEAAREADPEAVLYINDYSLDDATWGKVTEGMVPHVKKWREAGIPIDGIGTQAHLKPGMSGPIKGALQALADSGVDEVAITELDIEGADADEYFAVTSACLEVEKCVGISVWGVSDAESWIADKTPLLFDEGYQAKPAYWSAADAMGWSG